MRINGTAYSILGVTPEEFTGTALLPQVPDFWAPASMQAQLVPGQDWLHQPGDYRFQILGHLKPGFGQKQAEAETAALIRQFSTTYFTRERHAPLRFSTQRFSEIPMIRDLRRVSRLSC
jgi:hypothetical protein